LDPVWPETLLHGPGSLKVFAKQMQYTVFHGIVAAPLCPATWQASGKLFRQLQQRARGQKAAKRLRGAGRKDGASVKEINGLKIGKVNMSWAIACPGTGRLPRTNLFYAGPGRGQ